MSTKKLAKRRPGRPATGQQPRRQFRASDKQWAAYQAAAQARGVTRSAWMRGVLDRAAGR